MLRDNISPFNDAFQHGLIPDAWAALDTTALASINRVLTKEAELIAYITDFRVLAAVIVVCLPVVFFMNNPHVTKQRDIAAG